MGTKDSKKLKCLLKCSLLKSAIKSIETQTRLPYKETKRFLSSQPSSTVTKAVLRDVKQSVWKAGLFQTQTRKGIPSLYYDRLKLIIVHCSSPIYAPIKIRLNACVVPRHALLPRRQNHVVTLEALNLRSFVYTILK